MSLQPLVGYANCRSGRQRRIDRRLFRLDVDPGCFHLDPVLGIYPHLDAWRIDFNRLIGLGAGFFCRNQCTRPKAKVHMR
jgi:hypothetical protein